MYWTPAKKFIFLSYSYFYITHYINKFFKSFFEYVFAFLVKSPIFSYVNATLNDFPTIRSSGIEIEKLMRKRFDELQKFNNCMKDNAYNKSFVLFRKLSATNQGEEMALRDSSDVPNV